MLFLLSDTTTSYMSLHGEFALDTSKQVRVVCDEEGFQLRVLLLEDWYDRLKALYDYLEWIAAGVSVESIPEHIEACFEWLSVLSTEIGASGWIFTIGIVGWVTRLVKNQVSLGKFTYETTGRFGTSRFGNTPLGGGITLLELPVEG